MFRTTSVVPENAAVALRRYAHHAFAWRAEGMLMLFLLLLGLLAGGTVYREAPVSALNLNLIMLGLMLGSACITRIVLPRAVAQKHPWGTETIRYESWIDHACIHRLDEDGDVYAILLRKIRFAWRNEGILLLCTLSQAVVPVNLLMLSGEEQQALIETLKKECPKLKALNENRRSSL